MPDFPPIIAALIAFVATPFLILPLSALRHLVAATLPRALTVLCLTTAAAIWLAEFSAHPVPFALSPQHFTGLVALSTALWLGSVLLPPRPLLWFDLSTAIALAALAWLTLT